MISLKVFRMEESERTGLSESAIAMRMSRGTYRGLTRHVVNAREIYVTGQAEYTGAKHLAIPKRTTPRKKLDSQPITA